MIEPGTQIVCENGHSICKVGPAGLGANQRLSSRLFRDWKIQRITSGKAWVCPHCGGAIAESSPLMGFRIATIKGWRYADERMDRKVA